MIESLPGIAAVKIVAGDQASGPPRLLVEAPHGATELAHYQALAERMHSALPADLHEFFCVNTDVGSYELGRRVAERVVAADPTASVLVIRCLLPRTLVDVNRVVAAEAGDLATGGMTAAVPSYVRDPRDHALLGQLHAAYTCLVEEAYAEVCGAGGRALIQHTYGPVTLGIAAIDDDIVANLRAAHQPEALAGWPVRPMVDLITRDEEGVELCPPGAAEGLIAAYNQLDIEAVVGESYYLHPSTMGRVWSARYPGQVLCLEVRRDLLVRDWLWNQEMEVDPEAIDRFAGPLADFLAR